LALLFLYRNTYFLVVMLQKVSYNDNKIHIGSIISTNVYNDEGRLVMKMLDVVFCVGCQSMISRTQAEVVFRTGFYKITIPLAQCKLCADKSKSMNEASNHLVYMNNYEPAASALVVYN
jgi:hypothetical protein